MKIYIVGITILFIIGSYFFITKDENSISLKKVESTKNKEHVSSIDTSIEKEQKINYYKQENVIAKKDKISPKQVKIVENQEIQLFDENSAPLDMLDKIFLLRKGDKNDIPLQKDIASLESTLVAKLQNNPNEETYSMFKKLLNLEETTVEDKKYIVDLLEAVGTDDSKALLVEMYQNSDNEELKEKISKLDTPEVYTLLALEANQNGDTDSYQLMMNKLDERKEEEVISGFMAFTKSDDADSLDNLTQLIAKWSRDNLSPRSAEIAEEYLSKADAKPKERIVAISILANMKNREKRDHILKKALEYEENEDVVNFIQTILDSEN